MTPVRLVFRGIKEFQVNAVGFCHDSVARNVDGSGGALKNNGLDESRESGGQFDARARIFDFLRMEVDEASVGRGTARNQLMDGIEGSNPACSVVGRVFVGRIFFGKVVDVGVGFKSLEVPA
jgi:hypothetical protein